MRRVKNLREEFKTLRRVKKLSTRYGPHLPCHRSATSAPLVRLTRHSARNTSITLPPGTCACPRFDGSPSPSIVRSRSQIVKISFSFLVLFSFYLRPTCQRSVTPTPRSRSTRRSVCNTRITLSRHPCECPRFGRSPSPSALPP